MSYHNDILYCCMKLCRADTSRRKGNIAATCKKLLVCRFPATKIACLRRTKIITYIAPGCRVFIWNILLRENIIQVPFKAITFQSFSQFFPFRYITDIFTLKWNADNIYIKGEDSGVVVRRLSTTSQGCGFNSLQKCVFEGVQGPRPQGNELFLTPPFHAFNVPS
jgi:hypothetical protein